MLNCFLPFSLLYLLSNIILLKTSGKGIEGITRNNFDIYLEQSALFLGIQAVNSGILDQGVLDVKADCLNCSLGKFRQFLMIKLNQEVFEAGNILRNL